MTLLTIALFLDVAINIARIIWVERSMRAQGKMFAADQARRDCEKREIIEALSEAAEKAKP